MAFEKLVVYASENIIHENNDRAEWIDVDVRVYIVWLAANSNHSIIWIHALTVANITAATALLLS